ncbi:hypothetical protein EJ08DRAFT_702148 [Tothia fuscella]|uniref:Uncharacterized protein n=1 Tax=Tothia fuscella TaxID=1048955 RepID=A0A9P4TTV1_9PEZI|nr:hypothetical protein EJ08DRAFT_702148 [Tothia fuscella]
MGSNQSRHSGRSSMPRVGRDFDPGGLMVNRPTDGERRMGITDVSGMGPQERWQMYEEWRRQGKPVRAMGGEGARMQNGRNAGIGAQGGRMHNGMPHGPRRGKQRPHQRNHGPGGW